MSTELNNLISCMERYQRKPYIPFLPERYVSDAYKSMRGSIDKVNTLFHRKAEEELTSPFRDDNE